MAYTNKVDVEKYHSAFPERLRELMEENNVTQIQLARVIGVTPQAIGAYTRGETMPKLNIAQGLASFFDVSLDYLTGQTDVKSCDQTTQSIHKEIGLSEDAIEIIRRLKETGYNHLLSAFIESPHFEDAMHEIYNSLACTKSPSQRIQESWDKELKDLIKPGAIDEIAQKTILTFTRYSEKFVAVPRWTQSASFLQEASDKFKQAAKDALKTVEENHSMEEALLNVAKMELKAIEDSQSSV